MNNEINKFEAFERLKCYSKNLSSVSYEEIYDILKNGIKKIPIPLAKLKGKSHIDRVRLNEGKGLFNYIDDLGYIKNQDTIDDVLTSYGRANIPHQVMFYGALKTLKIDKQRLTAIAETSNIFRNSNTDCIEGEYCTVSRWETSNELLVVEIVFSEYALKNNPEIVKRFECQKNYLKSHNLEEKEINFHLNFLKFISEEFSKKLSNNDDYKISAAYTNLVLLHPEVCGIIYPSVQTKYFGENIVLPPKIVDKYLKPIVCSTHVVYKKGQKSLIANGGHYCDNIDTDKEIEWKTDRAILLTSDEVLKRLEDN